jgi:hypothetical protein
LKKLSGALLPGGLLALPSNIRLVWKSLAGTNTLGFYNNCITLATGYSSTFLSSSLCVRRWI